MEMNDIEISQGHKANDVGVILKVSTSCTCMPNMKSVSHIGQTL